MQIVVVMPWHCEQPLMPVHRLSIAGVDFMNAMGTSPKITPMLCHPPDPDIRTPSVYPRSRRPHLGLHQQQRPVAERVGRVGQAAVAAHVLRVKRQVELARACWHTFRSASILSCCHVAAVLMLLSPLKGHSHLPKSL